MSNYLSMVTISGHFCDFYKFRLPFSVLTECGTALLQGAHGGAHVVGVVAPVVAALTVHWLLFDTRATVPVQRQPPVAGCKMRKKILINIRHVRELQETTGINWRKEPKSEFCRKLWPEYSLGHIRSSFALRE